MSGKWCGAMRQVTRSKRASSKGSASASARAVSMLAKPLALASLAASCSISAVRSLAIDAGDVGRERRRRVSGAGGDVERLPGRLRLHQLDQPAEARALGVHGRRGVGRRMRAELLLDERFVHGLHLPLPTTWSQANMARGATPNGRECSAAVFAFASSHRRDRHERDRGPTRTSCGDGQRRKSGIGSGPQRLGEILRSQVFGRCGVS